MSFGLGGGGGHGSSSSSTGILSRADKKLRKSLVGDFASRFGSMGIAGFGLPAYGGNIVLPYSPEQNAGLRSLQGVTNPVDVAGVGTAARNALAYQFKNLITPDLLDSVGAGGGGRYSTAVADVAGKYLGSAELDLETELSKLDVNAQEAAKQRQMTLAQDQNAYLAILDPEQYAKQQQATAAYSEFARQWQGGGFFPTLWQSLHPNTGYSSQSSGNWNAQLQYGGAGGSGAANPSGGVGGVVGSAAGAVLH